MELPFESVVVVVPSEQETKKTTRQQNKKLFMVNYFTNDIVLFSKLAPIINNEESVMIGSLLIAR